jgi:tetrahydromethanopterin S-methyltransferase subunit B
MKDQLKTETFIVEATKKDAVSIPVQPMMQKVIRSLTRAQKHKTHSSPPSTTHKNKIPNRQHSQLFACHHSDIAFNFFCMYAPPVVFLHRFLKNINPLSE